MKNWLLAATAVFGLSLSGAYADNVDLFDEDCNEVESAVRNSDFTMELKIDLPGVLEEPVNLSLRHQEELDITRHDFEETALVKHHDVTLDLNGERYHRQAQNEEITVNGERDAIDAWLEHLEPLLDNALDFEEGESRKYSLVHVGENVELALDALISAPLVEAGVRSNLLEAVLEFENEELDLWQEEMGDFMRLDFLRKGDGDQRQASVLMRRDYESKTVMEWATTIGALPMAEDFGGGMMLGMIMSTQVCRLLDIPLGPDANDGDDEDVDFEQFMFEQQMLMMQVMQTAKIGFGLDAAIDVRVNRHNELMGATLAGLELRLDLEALGKQGHIHLDLGYVSDNKK